MLPYAPGSRILVRDEEWLVRRVDPSTDGGFLLSCDGVSELVRGRHALFLTELEDSILVLDPAKTEFVPDTSDRFNSAFLYLEAQLRRATPNDDRIHLGHRGAMDLVPYQLDPALQALRQPRQRILIADAVGLGKTMEAGILATELIQRGRGQRILVITLKSMLTQFQKEFWSRFSIPLVRLDSVGLQRVRNQIPSNHNPFNFHDRSIISIDTLKNNLEYRNYLENAWWDIIIIDECHNVAARAHDDGMSRRARLARLLAGRSDTLLLLSATPHDGSARSFASLMSLLDPTAISDHDDYTPDDFRSKGLVIRRFKKDIKDQVAADFPERVTEALRHPASPQEDAAYRALLAIPFTQKGEFQPGQQQELQRVAMQKAMFSSPFAALDSTRRRIQLLQAKPDVSSAEKSEIDALRHFERQLLPISASNFSKFQRLVRLLTNPESPWQPMDPSDRIVLFSERIETLLWLKSQLPAALGLHPDLFDILHGGMSDTEQQDLVDRFGRKDDPIRMLLCSDVASEGLNLHYFCHRLVHFDLPWSLMVFQQRNGRVDRYGQNRQPRITYLFTTTTLPKIQGDLRILEILQAKDDQANKNLGDPACFLNVHDPEKEALKVSEAMASGIGPEQFESQLDATAARLNDPLTMDPTELLVHLSNAAAAAAEATAATPASSTDSIAELPTLFGTPQLSPDYHFAVTALQQLSIPNPIASFTPDNATQTLALTAPLDLQARLKLILPPEARNPDHRYVLASDKSKVIRAIHEARQARAEDDTWPKLQFLWPQHPIMEWLQDRVLAAFGRHRAPVIQCDRMAPNEQAFLLMGMVPNRKGQPLMVEWRAALWDGNAWSLEDLPAFLARTGLKAGSLPNRIKAPDTTALQARLPMAVAALRAHLLQRRDAFAADMQSRLAGTLSELERLQDRQLTQLELRLASQHQPEQLHRSRRQQRTQQIHRVFDEYRQWVRDTMTTEPQPFLKVLAAVVR